MSREQRLPIPDNVNPPLDLCIQLTVPSDPQHLAILKGLLDFATIWSNWDRDSDQSGSKLARLYERISNSATVCETGKPVFPIVEEEMPLHVDCDCNVFVDCCDGSQVQLQTTQKANQPSQPSPQPQPQAGACSEIDVHLQANNKYLMPFNVGGGDVVTISELNGGWYDGGLDVWRCPTSTEYTFLGCGTTNAPTQSGDPCNTIPHMALIAKDSAGNCYDARSSFTIATGVPNGSQLVFQCNDSDITNNAGSASFHLKVCKNAVPHQLYYGLFTQDWVNNPIPSNVTWVPISVATPYTITSPVPDDASGGGNPRAFVYVTFADSFSPTTGFAINSSNTCFRFTALGEVNCVPIPADGYNCQYQDCVACAPSGGGINAGAFPSVPIDVAFFEGRSQQQFIMSFTVEICT